MITDKQNEIVVTQFIELITIAYSDAPDSEERKWQRSARIQHRKLVEREW